MTTANEKKEFYEERIEIARRCAVELYAKGAKRVWLFGSLADCSYLDHLTDIDIAVEGLKPPVLDRVRRTIIAREKTKIDVVCLETANPGFRNGILRKRVLLSKCSVAKPP
jgi:predicted nucleotidyltransferase